MSVSTLDIAKQPLSICTCGHSGDGPNSAHFDLTFEAGHGGCTFADCDCPRFSWAGFTLYGRKINKEVSAINSALSGKKSGPGV